MLLTVKHKDGVVEIHFDEKVAELLIDKVNLRFWPSETKRA